MTQFSGESALEEELIATNERLAERTRQYQAALTTIRNMERILSDGAVLATHVAYLCSTLPEGSTDIEQAASQLHGLLTARPGSGD